MYLHKIISILSFLVGFAYISLGQDDFEYFTLKTLDNEKYIGEVYKITNDSIFLYGYDYEIIGFAITNTKSFTIGIVIEEEYKYLGEPYFIPTALNNGKGNHYYKNYLLFGHNIGYGVNDNLDLTFGFETYSIFFGDNTRRPLFQMGINYNDDISESARAGISAKMIFQDQTRLILGSVPLTIVGSKYNLTFSPSLLWEVNFDFPEFVPMLNWTLDIGKNSRFITDLAYMDQIILGVSMIEHTFNKKFSILVGISFSNDFGISPNFGFVIPYGNWKQ